MTTKQNGYPYLNLPTSVLVSMLEKFHFFVFFSTVIMIHHNKGTIDQPAHLYAERINEALCIDYLWLNCWKHNQTVKEQWINKSLEQKDSTSEIQGLHQNSSICKKVSVMRAQF